MKLLKTICGLDIPNTNLAKRYQRSFLILAILTFLATAFEMVGIGAMVPLLGGIFGSTPASNQGWLVEGIVHVINSFPANNVLMTICILFLVLTILKVALKTARDVRRVTLTQLVLTDCQKEIFARTLESDLSFFVNHKSGDLVFRATSLPREISACFTLLPSIFVETVNVLFLCVLLLSISWQLFLCVAVFGLLYGLSIRYLSKNVFEVIGKEIPDALAWQNVIANEAFGGIREVITYGKRQEWAKRFQDQCDRYYRLRTRASVLRILPGNSLELLVVMVLAGLGIYYVGHQPQRLVQDLPVVAVYAMALMRMVPSFAKIGQERVQVASYLPSLKLYDEFMAKAPNREQSNHGDEFKSFKEGIIFDKVHFSYNAQAKVIQALDLAIPKNKVVAIVGGSGAGKSTLIDLLLGLYTPDSGAIWVDGKDLHAFSAASWRAAIGVVPQNLFVFNATAKANIAFDFGSIDMDKVIAASKAAGAHDFISQLKHGYDTELGDRGFALSGGQRQRVAIARALYRNPQIIIFDEATSALDNRVEKMITETIGHLAENKTVVILAHRLSTIERADIIYVVKNGHVVQSGTLDELRRQGGEFASLYV